MGKIIFELLTPILLMFYLGVDVLIPSFTKLEYFWFFKSLLNPKTKQSFEEEVKNAEQAYEDAKNKMEHLIGSSNDETKEAEKRLSNAKEILENAKKKVENLKK